MLSAELFSVFFQNNLESDNLNSKPDKVEEEAEINTNKRKNEAHKNLEFENIEQKNIRKYIPLSLPLSLSHSTSL